MESQVRGGTRWKRFAVVMVPSVAATAAIGVALAQGALAASFSVSGQEFKVTADTLHGEGFAQYGAVDAGYTLDGKKTAHAVAVSSFNDATITNMCQSVVTPDVPFLGNITLRLEAGGAGHDKVQAHNLYIDVDDLNADAVFNNIDIGVAAKDASKGPGMKGNGEQANPFGFAQQADSADLSNVRQTAWATTAGTFKLSGLHMSLHKGDGKGIECY
ncbi:MULTISPECIES: DUF6230 family protein [Streptomyces]|uniref:DUF6230 family protein n=1 Tax=Streptomyces TaxID=1883 RepID=UPI0005B8C0EB|nr:MULTISPECIES: DUF6230 family protein [Streptomyces]MDX2598071.1 DUF6230 family protein [Streptomyces sp. WI03-4A]UJA10541.1 cholesterol esterase [Streptomyces collinus]UJA14595.1 cholesterol esterase [Streptomyces collinus]